jgi:hypothetical protein
MRYGKALVVALAAAAVCGVVVAVLVIRGQHAPPPREIVHVYPGEDIQSALEAAAARPDKCTVQVHEGTYRPTRPGQALVYFNARHDGIVLEGVGEVVLTAANPDVADRKSKSYPAIVNHVVYFGDEISNSTVLRNVRITGGNAFMDGPPGLIEVRMRDDVKRTGQFVAFDSPIESNKRLPKSHMFFSDGAGILVHGRSYPTIENVEIAGNRSCLCGGGVSVQHFIDFLEQPVRFRNCIFRDNRAAVSGSAVDAYSPGSWVELENCLFVGNISDEKVDFTQDHGFGALTVLPMCRATVSHCTFTDNGSAVDDQGRESVYRHSIFWKNTRAGGVVAKSRFELNLPPSATTTGCFLHGAINDLHSRVPRDTNHFDPPDPDFDDTFRPRNLLYAGAGYRPR